MVKVVRLDMSVAGRAVRSRPDIPNGRLGVETVELELWGDSDAFEEV